ncbi:uncharacterized protein MELLADRAFT_91801 [Melampsora larici-populina 98AG31]|uniref:Secreted protein n=1 Tax=Melampsora larici-populina (strain 98AG31 / pathotype 3-4-7) TaxID=747676 RepID=F4S0D0_MELLP|nr:uncharacterized protein MELLADRAFT_91801 [Melampsora larici-populina 98AG31]EGG01941.1 secreted protein [Melampsora larici-populina 98AG31]
MLSTMPSVLHLLLLCFAGSKAFDITSPTETTTWDISAPIKIEWSTASTDPEKFDLQITNRDPNLYPEGITEVVKQDLNSGDGKVTLDLSGDNHLKSGTGYTINFIKSQSDEILAQSHPFSLTNDPSNSKSVSDTSNTKNDNNSDTNKTVDSHYSSPMNYPHTGASSPVFNSTDVRSDAKDSAHNSGGNLRPSFSILKLSWVLIVSLLISVLVI